MTLTSESPPPSPKSTPANTTQSNTTGPSPPTPRPTGQRFTILPPKGHRDLTKLTPAQQAIHAYAALDYRYHWSQAFDGRGYAPWGQACYHQTMHQESCPCKGTRQLIHTKQIEFHTSSTEVFGFIGGLGSGKSASGCAEAIRQAIDQPGSTGIVAAPTYKQLSASTKELFFKILHPLAIHRYDRVDEKLVLTNGSIIFFRSTEDPEPIRGVNAAWVFLDEGSTTTQQAWDILIGRVRQPGFRHRAFLTTTPKGLNWVYDYFASPKKKDGYSYVSATSMDNPHNTPDYFRRMKATFSDRDYQQEVLGEFVGFDGLVYPEFTKDLHVKPRPTDKKPLEVIYGHDFGFGHPNAIIAIHRYSTHLHVVGEHIESNLALDDLIEATRNMEAIHGKGVHVCDHEPLIIVELQKAGFHCTLANKAVDAGISTVAAQFNQDPLTNIPRLQIDPSCTKLIDELSRYCWDRPKDGSPNPVKPKVLKLNDDGADALRYAITHIHGTEGSGFAMLDLQLPKAQAPTSPDGLPQHNSDMFSLNPRRSNRDDKQPHWMVP